MNAKKVSLNLALTILLSLACTSSVFAQIQEGAKASQSINVFQVFNDRIGVNLEAATRTNEGYLEYYDRVVALVEGIQGIVTSNLSLETKLNLARAAHDIGYWQAEKLKVQNPGRLELGANLSQEAYSLLPTTGRRYYLERYEQFPTRKNKLTAKQIGITELDLEGRRAFFNAAGKTALTDAQLMELSPDAVVMNLYHADFDQMVKTGKKIRNPASQAAFLNQIVKNQISAIARTVIVNAVAQIDPSLNEEIRVAGEPSFTGKDKLTFLLWKFTGHYDGKEGFSKLPALVAQDYTRIASDIRLLDKTMNDAISKAVGEDVLAKIAESSASLSCNLTF